MIKRFHALYVGQIELDNIGLNGTPANDRRYSSERLAQVFETSRRVARVMDELGYYCFWAAEHHFQHEGYECIPNLIQWGLWLATQTKRLKFGCGFNILPMWHPIRLAEDYAMADIVTDGRVVMGVGRGYHTREVETLGGPLLDTALGVLRRRCMPVVGEDVDLRMPALGEDVVLTGAAVLVLSGQLGVS